MIITAALLLAQPQTPPASETAPAASAPARPANKGKPTTPPPPKPNVDPGIELPSGVSPEPPKAPSDPVNPNKDSIDPKDGSVKKVAPAPADPDKPAGVRPL